jgi:hypothetical protein
LRGRPYLPDNGVYTVRYDINPAGNNIAEIGSEARRSMMEVYTYPVQQNIVIVPKNAGFYELQFEADFYKGQNRLLKVPVYLYYDVINFNFKEHEVVHVNNKAKYSRIDPAQNAIFLGDGETLSFFADIDETKYKNNGLKYGKYNSAEALTFDPVTSGRYKDLKLNVQVQPNTVTSGGKQVLQLSIGSAGYESNFSYDSLRESVYAGLVTVNYNYPNGNKKPADFCKTYMLFIQLYNRH